MAFLSVYLGSRCRGASLQECMVRDAQAVISHDPLEGPPPGQVV